MRNLFLLVVGLAALCIPAAAQQARRPYIDVQPLQNGTYIFELKNVPVPRKRPGARAEAAWGYFWEFGDGSYSRDKVAYHDFDELQTFKVRVYLTPRYAASLPISFSRSFRPDETGPRDRLRPGGPLVSIVSNQELVPDQKMRIALTYKAPSSPISGGYLLFFYNKTREAGISYKPFRPIDPETVNPYDGARLLPAGSPIPDEAARLLPVRRLSDEADFLIFRVPAMKAHELGRVFLSVHAYRDLFQVPGEELSYTAIWAPGRAAFDPQQMVADFPMRVQRAHDPNYIRVEPRQAVLVPGERELLTFTVRFRNIGDDDASSVEMEIPLDRTLNRNQLRILTAQISDDPVPPCTDGVQLGCYTYRTGPTLESGRYDSSLYVVMRGITLAGRDSAERKRQSKGELKFRVFTKGNRVDRSKGYARILFQPGEDTIRTNTAATRFRRNGFGVMLGLSTPGDQSDLINGIGVQPTFGINYSLNPVNTGLSYAFEGIYGSAQFEQRQTVALAPGTNFSGGTGEYSSDLRLHYLDLNGQIRYSFLRLFAVGVGAGLSLPLVSRAHEIVTVRDNGGTLLDEITFLRRSGLLASETEQSTARFERLSYETPLPETQDQVGGQVFIDLGTLWVNSGLSFGLRAAYRYYPRVYTLNGACFTTTSFYANYKF